jgi:hypothetical protein
MPRRKPYTRVVKSDQIRAKHVRGMSDIVFKGFQCLNSECRQFIFVRKDEIGESFEIACPACGETLRSGDETSFYSYTLEDLRDNSTIEDGQFTILHDDYVAEAQEYKYCIVCNTLKPLEFFDHHGARKSGRQGECRLCKAVYNAIKNQTRLTDQHREAAQKRRLYLDLSGGKKIDSRAVFERFNHRCFRCGKDLRDIEDEKERPLDHTLPAFYLWPLTTENATLLCREHNGEKSGKWPSEYYSVAELKRLAVLTGIPFEFLAGSPQYNPEAITRLKTPQYVDQMLTKYSAYMPEIIKLRNRLLGSIGFDFFEHSAIISLAWIRRANDEYERTIRQVGAVNITPDIDV